MKRFALEVGFSLFLLGITCPLLAKVLYVSPDGNDLNSGLSWATAKRTVTAALQSALPDDQIWVRYGVYYERITLKSGVSLYGGFRGDESSLSQRPAFPRSSPDPYETVLDGNQGGSVVKWDYVADRAFRLDGFTVCNGKAYRGGGLNLGVSGSYLTVAHCIISGNSAEFGGGVYCDMNSSPTLTGCTITGNSATYGGGVACYVSSPTLSGCIIASNRANFGGGIYLPDNSSPTLSECTISRNSATKGGGVLCAMNSCPLITGCTISSNDARDYGGGVYCDSSSPKLNASAIVGNIAGSGGGVYCYSNSSPELTDCDVLNNSATYGAGVGCIHSSPTLTRCTISGNIASGSGGGVDCYSASNPNLTNCAIIGNSARVGGGVCAYSSSPTLANCYVLGNSASDRGGGVFSYRSSVVLSGCTITGNSASQAGGIMSDASTKIVNSLIASNLGGGVDCLASPDIRYNCVWGNMPWNYSSGTGDRTGADGNISKDPLMVAGHLLPESPCIDAGDNSLVGVDADIDGEARIANGTVDIGADEFHPPIVHGILLFNDLAGNLPPMVDWEIRRDSTEVRRLLLDANGGFVLPRAPARQFALSVKPLSYLRRTVEVDTNEGSVLDLEISLTNGDIDGDNEVTLFDFGRLVAAFGSAPGGIHWDPRADLDGDLEVTLYDFAVLVRNFGEFGDE